MTEYDYSPAALERHLETQHRISNWTHQTAQHASQFTNPFKPTDADSPSRSEFYSKPKRSKSVSSSGRKAKPLPPPPQPAARHIEQPLPPKPQPQLRISSIPRPPPLRSSTANAVYPIPAPPARAIPIRSSTVPVQPTHSRAYEYALRSIPGPIAKPPGGQKIDVSSPTSPTRQHIPSPTKKSQPLLKRLLTGNLGSNADSKSTRSGSSSSSRTGVWSGGKPRRDRGMSV